MRLRKPVVATALIVVVVLVSNPGLAPAPAAAGDVPAPPPAAAAACPECARDRAPVAMIDGTPITRAEFKEYLLAQFGEARIETFVNEKLLEREAARLGIKVTPDEVKDWVEERIREITATPEYRMARPEDIRAGLGPQAAMGLLVERLVKARRTSEEGIRHEYELRYGERRRGRHILFQVTQRGKDGKLDPAAVLAAKKRAEETLAQIRNGADFGELAKKISEDRGSAPHGGELPEFGKGDMVPEFAEVAFALKEGEISEPVLSPFGWHLIQITKVVPPAKPFDEALAAELRKESAMRPIDRNEMQRLLDELRAKAKIEVLHGE